MRLKEIKPGMAIHCKNDEEKKALYDELCRIGHMKLDSFYDSFRNFKITSNNYIIKNLKLETWGFTDDTATVEFSDLILPELTAEELLNTIKEICASSNTCNDMCLLCDGKGCVNYNHDKNMVERSKRFAGQR